MKVLVRSIAAIALLFICNDLFPQDFWEKTGGPAAANIQCFAESGDGDIYAGDYRRIYKMNNVEDTWQLVYEDFFAADYLSIHYSADGNVYAGTAGYMSFSVDGGQTWGLSLYLGNYSPVFDIDEAQNGRLFAAAYGNGVYYSDDKGENWTHIISDMDSSFAFCLDIDESGNIFCGTRRGGIFKSADVGLNWTHLETEMTTIIGIEHFNDTMYAATPGKLFFSADQGGSWSEIELTEAGEFQCMEIDNSGRVLLGMRNNGIYYVRFGEVLMTGILNENAIKDARVNCIFASSGGRLFANAHLGNVVYSDDDGENWKINNNGFGTCSIRDLAISPDQTIFAATLANGVFSSTDKGNSWQNLNNGAVPSSVRTILITDDEKAYAGSYAGLFTLDEEQNWISISDTSIHSIAYSGESGLFVGTADKGVYHVADEGRNWTQLNEGFGEDLDVTALMFDSEGYLYAGLTGFYSGIYRSQSDGELWERKSTGLGSLAINAIAEVADKRIIVATAEGGIYSTDDKGEMWNVTSKGLMATSIFDIAAKGKQIFIGAYRDGCFMSSDNGENWIEINSGIDPGTIFSMALDDDGYIFAGAEYGGVYKSREKIVSVGEPSGNDEIEVFPNPSSDRIFIRGMEKNNIEKVVLYDLYGRRISEYQESWSIEIRDLTAGTYFLKICSAQDIVFKRFVKY